MRITVLPKTLLGRWSVGLAIPSLFLSTYQIWVRLGRLASLIATYLNMAFVIAGMAAFVIGLISIIKRKERSILVFVALALGLLCWFFVLGEFLFPH